MSFQLFEPQRRCQDFSLPLRGNKQISHQASLTVGHPYPSLQVR
jgi:hypothetical protein